MIDILPQDFTAIIIKYLKENVNLNRFIFQNGQIIKRSEELHKLIHEQMRRYFMVIYFSCTPIGEHFCYLNRKISKI